MRWMNSGDFFDALHPPPFRCFHNPRHRPHGNLVRTGYQGGRRCRAGRVAETRLEIFIRGPGPLRGSPAPAKATAGAPTIGQDHRRGDERSTAGRRKANDLAFRARNARSHSGGLGRRHTFTLRGADPAPRFPTAPEWESSLTTARRESGRATEKLVLKAPSTARCERISVTKARPCPSGHPTLLSPATKTGVWNAL